MKNINITTSIEMTTILPFDIRKAIYDASKIDGIIYIHPFLFDSVYRWSLENIHESFQISSDSYFSGNIKIQVTDLLAQNEYRVMTKMEFIKEFENGK